MERFLRFGFRLEGNQTLLEIGNPLHRARWNAALTLQWPCLLDHIASVFPKESFQLGTLWFRVGADTPIERSRRGCLATNSLFDVGMILVGRNSQQSEQQTVHHPEILQEVAENLIESSIGT